MDQLVRGPEGDGAASRKEFWTNFAGRHWERTAALLTGQDRAAFPVISATDLFTAITDCVEEFCARGAQRVRFYVDGREVDARGGRNEALLPDRRDGSFEDYNLRLGRVLNGADYALVIADWHQFDRAFWERLLQTIHDLSVAVGITPTWIDTQMFLGNYKVTPFGVHDDRTSAFHFPVVGRKVMRFWNDSFVRENPRLNRSKQYEEFAAHSTVVEAAVGEGIYWPSDHWHIAESDGSFTATWGVGYWLDTGLREAALRVAQHLIQDSDRKASPVWPQDLVDSPSAIVGRIHSDIEQTIANDAFRLEVTELCLRHLSAFGFRQVPRLLEPAPLSPSTDLRKKDAFPILSAPLPGDQLCIAAGGYSGRFHDGPELRELVTRLNSGRSLPAQLLADVGVLYFLLRVGVLTAA